MRKQEQRLWDTMRTRLGHLAKLDRVENVALAGMPDVYVCRGSGPDFWVELKAPNRPKRKTTPLLGEREGLSPEQINWFIECAMKRGTEAYILIRDSAANMYLFPGRDAHFLNSRTVEQMEPYRTGWLKLEDLLK